MDRFVTTLKLSNEAVTEAKIASQAVSTGKIESYAVTAVKLASDSVTASKIDAGAVTAQAIAAGAVTAIKIDVATLDAISANCGTLTAGIINGVTIYAGGGDVTLDTNGIAVYGGKLKIYTAPINFYYSTTLTGYMGAYGTYLGMYSTNNKEILIDSDHNLTLRADGNVYLDPGSSSYVEILSNMRVYANRMSVPTMSSEPSGSNGDVYYNTTMNEFRGYRGGAWRNIQT